MQTVIYSSEQHKQTIEIFTDMCKQFVEEVTTKNKYQNYIEVLRTINEYSNGYGQGVKENNFYDWLMIIPINTSVATNGFFAGIETYSNDSVCHNIANNKNISNLPNEKVDNSSLDKLELIDKELDKIDYWYDREIFKLYYYEGNTLDSLAAKTNISRNSIFTTIDKVRNILKKELNEDV